MQVLLSVFVMFGLKVISDLLMFINSLENLLNLANRSFITLQNLGVALKKNRESSTKKADEK